MNRKYQNIIDRMTLEEKCAMLSGKKAFSTRGYQKYKIPEMQLSDGPHGLRKQDNGANHLGLGESVRATCFPTAATIACSWDPELGEKIGEALGKEAAAQEVGVLLGPGLNMKRSPLCGRNFEYFSEDPYLAGKMAAGYIRGIQKNGLSACPKHFAVNNQEHIRMSSDSIVDERTLREIYLTGFEIAVKEGHPGAIMSAYNKVNGVYANENAHLLRDILKKEWGFDGLIVTDWGGSDCHTEGVRQGSALEMPVAGGDSVRELIRAVKRGELEESAVDDRLEELLELVMQTDQALAGKGDGFDEQAHHRLAGQAAAESIVLLKNRDHILPLKKGTSVAVIGDFARTPRYQGAGSSVVNPTKAENFLDTLEHSTLKVSGFAAGYRRHGGEDRALQEEALRLATAADYIIFCMGLDEMKESEGLDRSNMKIADNQRNLLHEVAKANPNVIVVLSAGSPVEMPWLPECRALLHGYLGGQAGAGAMADVLTGIVNPSGKLAETYAMSYEETPACNYFPGEKRTSEYREGMFIGYRYYDTAQKEVTFPFGFGLSYTTYDYTDLKVSREGASCSITNTGDFDGAEIVQLYVHRVSGDGVIRPEKELKGFARVELKKGETKKVTVLFDDKTFRYFDIKDQTWKQEGGLWEIQLGAGSRDIRLRQEIRVEGAPSEDPFSGRLPQYRKADVQKLPDEEFRTLLGHEIPEDKIVLDRNITFGQLIHGRSPVLWIVWGVLTLMLKFSEKKGKPDLNLLFIYNMPLRALAKMTGGKFSMGMADSLVMEAKGFWFIGLLRLLYEAIGNQLLNMRMERKLDC